MGNNQNINSVMKKVILIASLVLATTFVTAQNRWFVGGTASIGYVDKFTFGIEPQVGYEITDRWAVGSSIGMTLVSGYGATAVLGSAEPFVRFCVWHNELVYIDLSAVGGFVFDDELEGCLVGLRPGLRFRLNDHWDVAANLGLFGAQFINGSGWTPAFGLSASSAALYVNYRF